MPRFRYCLNSSTIRPTPILEKIRIAGEVGFGAIELWHDDIDAHLATGGTLAEIRRALDDHGLAVPTTIYLKGWIDTTGDAHRRELDECRRRMHQSVAVGAEFIIAGPAQGHVDRALAGRNYHELLEIGLSIGVKPAMEFLGFVEEICRIEDAVEVMDRSGHPAATIVLDPFHCFRGGGSIETIAALPGRRIAISHFNDTPAAPPRLQQHDRDRVMPGDGHLDLKRYLALLEGTGYDRWLSLELFREDLWAADPREVARIGLEKMKAVVES